MSDRKRGLDTMATIINSIKYSLSDIFLNETGDDVLHVICFEVGSFVAEPVKAD
jgi:hypothetical protein